MTAWTGSSLRSAVLCAALLFSLSGVSLVLHAQTTDPRVVEFAPSPDHDRVVSGVAVVNRYALEFYLLNGLVVLQTIDLGKPNPGTDGIIRAQFSSLLGSWPVLGAVYQARVTAIGPGGSTASALSNQFSFAGTTPAPPPPAPPPPSPPPPAPPSPPPPAPCTYSLSQTSRTVPTAATSGGLTVTTGSSCTWSASSSSSWLTVSNGTNRTGTGAISYSVSANSSTAVRIATLTIAGAVFTLTQSGACGFSITPTSQSFNPPGGTASVAVTAAAGCSWTATRAGSWITITSGSSGTGNGTVRYRVSANSGASTRKGTLTIAGQPVTITQSASTAPDSPNGLRIVVVK